MEDLRTEPIKIKSNNGIDDYLIKEMDHGDLVVYDVYHQDHYLLTLSKDGSILFMNFDADEAEQEIFKISHLNQFIDRVKNLS